MKFLFLKESDSASRLLRSLPRGRINCSFTIKVSQDSEKSESRRWKCLSSGSISTVIRTLFAKWLWTELRSEELEFFILLPGVLTDPVMYSCLVARAQGLPKKVIREKLFELQDLGLIKVPSFQQARSMIGQLLLIILEENLPLRKTRKYSGYARHHNDKGSINPSSSLDLPNNESDVSPQFITEEFMIGFLFSVYSLPFFNGAAVLTTGSNKNRNGEKLPKKVKDGTIL
jgi:hypothetical protein